MMNSNDTLLGNISSNVSLNGSISSTGLLNGTLTGGQNTNTDYLKLNNKPQINNVTLEQNKSFNDLGAKALTNMQIENLINSIV